MSHPRGFPIVLLAIAAGACDKVADGVRAPFDAAAATDIPAPVAEVAAQQDATPPQDVAATVDVQPDAPADLPGDLSPKDGPGDSPADDQLSRYHKFLQDSRDHIHARQTACFGTSPASLRDPRPPSSSLDYGRPDRMLRRSMRLGMVTFDDGAAAACLRTLDGASCQEIAAMHALGLDLPAAAAPECTAVLAEQIPKGGPCLDYLMGCGPSLMCETNFAPGCSFCVPKPAPLRLGEKCSDTQAVCATDTVCTSDDARSDQFCQPALPNNQGSSGSPCGSLKPDCKQGLYCATADPYPPGGIVTGICRPLQLGIPCAGPAECFDYYVCAGATSKHGGTCQVGKGSDQTCTIFDYQDRLQPPPLPQATIRFSDCAPGFACVDLDQQGRKCVAGSPLGGICGSVDLQFLDCLEGYCEGAHDDVSGVCRPLKATGSPCQEDSECVIDSCIPPSPGQPTVCLPHPPQGPPSIGQHCAWPNGHISDECEDGAYCAPPPDFHGVSFPAPRGFCAPMKKTGESCRAEFDKCEYPATCVNSVCTPCR